MSIGSGRYRFSVGDLKMKMLFVGGTGRSGTTIVKRCIAEDLGVASFSRELRWMCDPDGLVDLYWSLVENWDPYRGSTSVKCFDDLYSSCFRKTELGVFARSMLSRAGVSGPKYSQLITKDRGDMIKAKNRFISALGVTKSRAIWYGSPSFRFRPVFYETTRVGSNQFVNAVNTFIEEVADLQGCRGAQYLLDDTPYSVLNYQFLTCIFPDAKFLNVVRDPFQVAESYARQPWTRDLSGAIPRLAAVYDELIRIENSASAQNWLTLRLEDAVSYPDNVQNEMAAFIDLKLPTAAFSKKFDENIITPSRANLSYYPEGSVSALKKARDFYGYSDD